MWAVPLVDRCATTTSTTTTTSTIITITITTFTIAATTTGYYSAPIDGAPFDATRGVVPSEASRVTGAGPGLYVTGWLKRGPSGVILNNIPNAAETAAAVLADRAAGKLARTDAGDADSGGDVALAGSAAAVIDGLLGDGAGGGARVVDFAGWARIDAEEVRRGEKRGRVRQKLTSVAEMLDVALR